MRRLPALVLGVLVAATVGAFFVTQHLKVTTPLIQGSPAPDPSVINPLSGGACDGVDHRFTRLSFWLQNRSDTVDVYVIDQAGTIVRTVASGRRMRRGVRKPDGEFSWDGREDNGRVAPAGTYFFKVALIHQGRTVVISNASGPEAVTVETSPPHPVVRGLSPAIIPVAGHLFTRIHYTGNERHGGYITVYRTDLPGGMRLVKRFGAPWTGGSTTWDGRIGGQLAPAGVYLVGATMRDAACASGSFPAHIPPRDSTPHAGLTVRYVAAEPPMTPSPAGSQPIVFVDSRQRAYRWSLAAPGARKAIASGSAASVALRVPLPGTRAGLYELAVTTRAGRHTLVPVVASASRPQRVLVVLPALTWQGLNPVDDDGDGFPNTLPNGGPIELARPLADGLPEGFADEAVFLAYLDATHRAYDLTTDLGLIDGIGPALAGHAAVVLAGSERWVPPSLASALRRYVRSGGHIVSLGLDSLRRSVTIRVGSAVSPTRATRVDVLGAAPGALVTHNRDLVTVSRDDLGIFAGTSGAFAGFASFQPVGSVTPPAQVISEAGTSTASGAIVGYRLGNGVVVDIGLAGFGSSLAHNVDAQELVNRLWTALSG